MPDWGLGQEHQGGKVFRNFPQSRRLPPPSASTHNFLCQEIKEEHIIQFNNLYKLKSLPFEIKLKRAIDK